MALIPGMHESIRARDLIPGAFLSPINSGFVATKTPYHQLVGLKGSTTRPVK
jgi:hypothetical protein